ncbi:MAG: exonuclease domain-containing protein [Ruminococcus sp.]|nr:exonuclease domain-containing protein [Ruminococcus sp.]
MSFVILDLEWNAAYSKKRKKHINEIFEFGAVKIDDNRQIIDRFSVLVKPSIGKFLNPYVKKLTHISFEELQSAQHNFQSALAEFADFLGDSILMTWSTSDLLALIENQNYFTGTDSLRFLTRYCDLQSYCEYILGVGSSSRQLGLSTCAELLSIDTQTEHHRALSDAELSYLCFKKLYKKVPFEEFVEDAADEEFYRKLTFKSKHITDLKSPLVDRSKMFFDCPECSTRCIQKTKWNVRSNSFKAVFVCPECKKEFDGRVCVKQKYEGIVFTKKIVELPVKEEEPKSTSKPSENAE